MNKILVILGPTSSGKTSLAISLARKFDGEIISADSRQVYRGLNLGTGKVTKKEMLGVPHHMLDVAHPKKRYDVATWKKETERIISEIFARGKLPILCGGTAFYIQSIVQNVTLPEVPPNPTLRKKLEQKKLSELITILGKIDPDRLKTIDTKNPVRIIRAIEIAKKIGKVPMLQKNLPQYKILQIGLDMSDILLNKQIHTRLLERIKKGMVGEAKKLHAKGLSWKRMHELGLEYRFLALLLQKKISKNDFVPFLQTEIQHYVRRQRQWWKRDNTIAWFWPNQTKKIEAKVKQFLHS